MGNSGSSRILLSPLLQAGSDILPCFFLEHANQVLHITILFPVGLCWDLQNYRSGAKRGVEGRGGKTVSCKRPISFEGSSCSSSKRRISNFQQELSHFYRTRGFREIGKFKLLKHFYPEIPAQIPFASYQSLTLTQETCLFWEFSLLHNSATFTIKYKVTKQCLIISCVWPSTTEDESLKCLQEGLLANTLL